jgi:hypothetical protein
MSPWNIHLDDLRCFGYYRFIFRLTIPSYHFISRMVVALQCTYIHTMRYPAVNTVMCVVVRYFLSGKLYRNYHLTVFTISFMCSDNSNCLYNYIPQPILNQFPAIRVADCWRLTHLDQIAFIIELPLWPNFVLLIGKWSVVSSHVSGCSHAILWTELHT